MGSGRARQLRFVFIGFALADLLPHARASGNQFLGVPRWAPSHW
jgi:hypothetical protein